MLAGPAHVQPAHGPEQSARAQSPPQRAHRRYMGPSSGMAPTADWNQGRATAPGLHTPSGRTVCMGRGGVAIPVIVWQAWQETQPHAPSQAERSAQAPPMRVLGTPKAASKPHLLVQLVQQLRSCSIERDAADHQADPAGSLQGRGGSSRTKGHASTSRRVPHLRRVHSPTEQARVPLPPRSPCGRGGWRPRRRAGRRRWTGAGTGTAASGWR